MRTVRHALLLVALSATSELAHGANSSGFTFRTTEEFVRECDGGSPPYECRNAILYVEEVVDYGDDRNATCDGGPAALLKPGTSEGLEALLAERLARVVPWLKQNPQYNSKSYGDGISAALKGVYCR